MSVAILLSELGDEGLYHVMFTTAMAMPELRSPFLCGVVET